MAMFGDIPGKGKYRCVICGFELELKDSEELDLCPLCEGASYDKVD